MVSRRTAQTGNRVYNGVSQSPNRGQVSAQGAQGYVQREVRKQAMSGVVRPKGPDGKSDSRSTVAAQSLQRQRQQQGPSKANAPKPAKLRGRTMAAPNPARSQPSGPAVGPVAPSFPPITISANGVLELPYDQEAAEDEFQANYEANENLAALDAADRENLAGYNQNVRDSGIAYESLRRQTLDANAARGTAFSSQHGIAAGDNARDYSNHIGDLNTARNNFLAELGQKRTGIQTGLTQRLGLIAQRRAHRLNEDAGDLGFGTSQSPNNNPSSVPGTPGRGLGAALSMYPSIAAAMTPKPPKAPKNDPKPPKKDPPKKGKKK